MESKLLKKFIKKGTKTLTEHESKEVLREYNIDCPEEFLIKNDGGIIESLSSFEPQKEGLSYPLFLKISSRDILHKTEAGTIAKVTCDEELLESGKDILRNAENYNPDAEIDGILVSEDVSGGEKRELFVGSTLDETFGHVISFGVGGIAIEVYEDVEFRATPLEEKDVRSMVENLRAERILREFRGKPPIDMEALTNTMLRFSKLVEENGEIEEIDVNPLFAGPEEIIAADALITLSTDEKSVSS